MLDKQVPATCEALEKYTGCLPLEQHAEMVHTVNKAVLCPGNPEDKFVDIFKKKGGTMKGDRAHGDVVAYIDKSTVIDSQVVPFAGWTVT